MLQDYKLHLNQRSFLLDLVKRRFGSKYDSELVWDATGRLSLYRYEQIKKLHRDDKIQEFEFAIINLIKEYTEYDGQTTK